MDSLADGLCFSNKYHPPLPRCAKPAVWKGRGTDNVTDDFEWCHDHAPRDSEYRAPIER